jgi:hypothetical protein
VSAYSWDRRDDADVRVDFLPETADGPLVRFAGDSASVALLHAVFEQLAAGRLEADLDFLTFDQIFVDFRCDARGGMSRTSPSAFAFDGDPSQWVSRAGLLAPLTEPPPGFQDLDYEGAGELAVVVTTYGDGGF